VEKFLKQLMGKRVDISCGNDSIVRGDVVSVTDELLHLRDENERVIYVAINKIAIIWEVKEQSQRPGFVLGKQKSEP